MRRAGTREPLPQIELSRADFVWAGATGLASAALFATVLTSHTYLGDTPEAISGVSSLGILHDPGYPAYVLTAHLFTLLVPVGDEALRVNLFSLVCGALTVAAVQLLARRCGVARWAGSVGALALAASAGFWYYTGLAKHDIFSGLLFVVTLQLALAWRARPTTGRLVALAAALAFGLGSSWPLEVLTLPTVAFVLWISRRQLSLRSLAPATATGLAVLVAVFGFVIVRAGENPAVNWGGATTISRLWQLVNRADFSAHGGSAHGPSASSSGGSGASSGVARSPSSGRAPAAAAVIAPAALSDRVKNYVATFGREFGVLGLLLAAFGLVASLTWRRSKASYPVLIAFVVNLIAATAVVGFGVSAGGLDSDLVDEGFLLGCYFALACWLAIGVGELAAIPGSARLAGHPAGTPGYRMQLTARARWLGPVVAVALATALLIPLVLDNWSNVHRSSRPFADRYAATMFGELPKRSAVFILGAELAQPLIYQQVVDHRRPDVVVVAADGIEYPWYREQLSRRLGISLPAQTGSTFADAAQAVKAIARTRPVYLDAQAAQGLSGYVGYRPVGLLARILSGRGMASVSAPGVIEQRLLVAERQAGFPDHNWDVWPQYVAQAEYATAALGVAQAYYQHRNYAGMRSALLNELSIQPGDPIAESDLAALNRIGAGG